MQNTSIRIRLSAALALAISLTASPSLAEQLYTNNFARSSTITVSGYAGSSVLTNFPVLVRLSAGSPTGFSYADCQSDGSDLRFTDSSGNLIPHEIDTWDTNGTSCVWIKVPVLSGTETSLLLYYGAGDQQSLPAVSAADVWTRYVVVIHGGDTVANSVGNGISAYIEASEGVAATTNACVAGGGVAKTKNACTGVMINSPSSKLSDSGKFSVSGWFKRAGNGGNNNGTHILAANRKEWSNSLGFLLLQEKGQYISVASGGAHNWSSGSHTLANNTWGHVAFTYDDSSTNIVSYFNGIQDQSATGKGSLVSENAEWAFGSYVDNDSKDNMNGLLDELRVYDGVASADWLKAECDSATNTSFAVLGEVVSANPNLPILGAASASVSENAVAFSAAIISLAASADVSILYSRDGVNYSEFSLGTATAAGTLSKTMENSDTGTYTWYVRAVSTVDETEYVSKSSARSFTVTRAKDPTGDYKTFTATVMYQGESASNIPALLRISEEGISGFDYDDVTSAGIEILSEDGDILPFEIDTWNTSGESLVWVLMPSFEQGAKVVVRYGGIANSPLPASAAWTDYVGVWHLNDLVANSNYGVYSNSTATVGIDGEKASASVAGEDGAIGKSVLICDGEYTGTADNSKGGVFVPDSGDGSPLDLGSSFAISGWFRHKNQQYFWDHMLYKRLYSDNTTSTNGSFAIEINKGSGTEGNIAVRGSSNTILNPVCGTTLIENWSYLTFVFNGSTASMYQDGALVKSGSITAVTDNDAMLCFGNSTGGYLDGDGNCAWCGWIDEVRLIDGVPSASWIAAEYAAMTTNSDPIAYSVVSSKDATSPVLSTPTVAFDSEGIATVSVVVSENAPADGTVYCTINGTDYQMSTSDASLPMTYTATVSGVTPGTYTVIAKATSTGGNTCYSAESSYCHFGSLAISVITNAYEGALWPGVFRVSRADADSTSLPAQSFDVAFSGTGLSSAAATVPSITSATIPAGESYVDIAVTPSYNTDVTEDTTVTLSVSGSNIGTSSSETLTVFNADYDISVRYVATTGDDANDGTAAAPKATIGDAVESLKYVSQTQPCVVHVAEGLYKITSPILVTNAISVLGADPSLTVVSNTVKASDTAGNKRVFYVNHPDALVANLTMQNGSMWGTYAHGGVFLIDSQGGIVSNCCIEAGKIIWGSHCGGAGGSLESGKVTHCIFRGNNCGSGASQYGDGGAKPGVLRLQGSAMAENCLIVDNPQSTAVVLVKVDGTSTLRNCTIVNSPLSATNENCKTWSSIYIASGATVQNVVIAGVTNTQDGAVCYPRGTRANFTYGALEGDLTDLGFDSTVVSGTAADFFKDYANGDYRPKSGGALVNAGTNYVGLASLDLAGNSRLVGSKVDIGAYECQSSGFTIHLR